MVAPAAARLWVDEVTDEQFRQHFGRGKHVPIAKQERERWTAGYMIIAGAGILSVNAKLKGWVTVVRNRQKSVTHPAE
jgi:hypothetical protein